MGRNGKKIQKGSLGKALVRTQTKASGTNTFDIKSSAGKHVSQRDGGDATVPLASYLEGSSLDDFLASAVLANRDFTAIRDNIDIIDQGLMGPTIAERRVRDEDIPEMSFQELHVPRRPSWDITTTAEELNAREKESFMAWRRDIALLEQSQENCQVTPFEKNLEVWRQLWHVRERSDVLIQIVDARNPLFYRSTDLEKYAKEGEIKRRTLLIVNKSDFLTEEQREAWGEYFDQENVETIFFSAKSAQDEIDEEAKRKRVEVSSENPLIPESQDNDESSSSIQDTDKVSSASSRYPVLSRTELLTKLTNIADDLFKVVGHRTKDNGLIKIGMVGFPNVGKSSVINALLGASTYSHKTQRVAVGATPGKTKHFQTMILSDRIMLCDCPGLVFPSFVNSKAEMYCCGVLPISQLRDHVEPCELVSRRIPKLYFERTYGIKIPTAVAASPTTPVDVYSLLETYARNRGYTTTGKGGPDTSRAARDILRHYVSGKLLYCHPPPTHENSSLFNIHEVAKRRFPEIVETSESATSKTKDSDEMESQDSPDEKNEELTFDVHTEEKKVVSKRLKKHGKKGRKARDKNPYESADFPPSASLIHVNTGGKKRVNPRDDHPQKISGIKL